MASVVRLRNLLYVKYYVKVDGKLKIVQDRTGLRATKENWKKAKILAYQKTLELKKSPGEFLLLKRAEELFLETKKSKSKKTRIAYEVSFRHFPDKTIFVKDINREHFNIILNSGLSHNSKSTYLRHIRILFSWLVKEGYIQKNPVPILREINPEIKTIPKEHFQKALETAQKRNKQWYYSLRLIELTGFRNNEATRLRWEDVDFLHKLVHVRNHKGNRTDQFPLFEKLEELLNEIKKDGFNHNYKEQILGYSPTEIMSFLPDLCDYSGIPRYTFHDIRRTFATNLVSNKISIFDAMKLLRHKQVETTLKFYAKAEIDRLGNELNGLDFAVK